jgi:hypothetical protein
MRSWIAFMAALRNGLDRGQRWLSLALLIAGLAVAAGLVGSTLGEAGRLVGYAAARFLLGLSVVLSGVALSRAARHGRTDAMRRFTPRERSRVRLVWVPALTISFLVSIVGTMFLGLGLSEGKFDFALAGTVILSMCGAVIFRGVQQVGTMYRRNPIA